MALFLRNGSESVMFAIKVCSSQFILQMYREC